MTAELDASVDRIRQLWADERPPRLLPTLEEAKEVGRIALRLACEKLSTQASSYGLPGPATTAAATAPEPPHQSTVEDYVAGESELSSMTAELDASVDRIRQIWADERPPRLLPTLEEAKEVGRIALCLACEKLSICKQASSSGLPGPSTATAPEPPHQSAIEDYVDGESELSSMTAELDASVDRIRQLWADERPPKFLPTQEANEVGPIAFRLACEKLSTCKQASSSGLPGASTAAATALEPPHQSAVEDHRTTCAGHPPAAVQRFGSKVTSLDSELKERLNQLRLSKELVRQHADAVAELCGYILRRLREQDDTDKLHWHICKSGSFFDKTKVFE